MQGAGNGEGGVDGGIERGGKEVMMPSLFGAEVTEGYMSIRQIKRFMKNSEPSRTKKTINPNSRGVASNAYFTPDVGAQVCHLSPPSLSLLQSFSHRR